MNWLMTLKGLVVGCILAVLFSALIAVMMITTGLFVMNQYETSQIEIEVAAKEQMSSKYSLALYIKSIDGDVYMVKNCEDYIKIEEGNSYIVTVMHAEDLTSVIISIEGEVNNDNDER